MFNEQMLTFDFVFCSFFTLSNLTHKFIFFCAHDYIFLNFIAKTHTKLLGFTQNNNNFFSFFVHSQYNRYWRMRTGS